MQPTVKLTSKGYKWLRSGHLWIYREDVAGGLDKIGNGEIVRIELAPGMGAAWAFSSARSKIALRVISRFEAPPEREFFQELITKARDRRGKLFAPDAACRLVSAEGDLFPGLIVDHYAGHLVIQIMIPGVEKIRGLIIEVLDELFSPKSITLRNDLHARALEGLAEEKVAVKGVTPRKAEIREGGMVYLADLWEGHKTGAYLDQQENRITAGALARGRCLDAFSFQGHFALHLARAGDEVFALDSSAPALAILQKNTERNGLKNITPVKANVFDHLAALDRGGERFDTIVLDPPPFAKSRKDAEQAKKGYKQLNLRAIRLLNPGSRLFTYSCSYNILPAAFLDTVRDAAADAGREMRLLAAQTQSPDHPVLLSMPETHYLKGLALEAY